MMGTRNPPLYSAVWTLSRVVARSLARVLGYASVGVLVTGALSASAEPIVSVGSSAGTPLTVATVNIALASNGAHVIAIAPLEMGFDPSTLEFVTCSSPLVGAVVTPATVAPGDLKVVAFAGGQTFTDGTIIACTFVIRASAAAGPSAVTFVQADMSDDRFTEIRATGTDGSVEVAFLSPTAAPSSTSTETPSAPLTATQTFSSTQPATPSPTRTATVTPSATSTVSPTRTSTNTPTLTPVATTTTTATTTPSATNASTQTSTSTGTQTQTPSPSATPSTSATSTVTTTRTETPFSTQPATASPTPTRTSTATPRPTLTLSATFTVTATKTSTDTPAPTHTATYTRTRTPAPSDTPIATPTIAETPTKTATSTLPQATIGTLTPKKAQRPTRTPAPCVGDCDDDGTVTIDELLRGVNIALGNAVVGECPAFDCNDNSSVTIDCLVKAVNAALNGCTPKPAGPNAVTPSK